MRRLVEQAGDDAALAGAEFGLAVFLEEFTDCAAGGVLDFVVGVDERQAEAQRQPLADRALAGAHQAHKGDGARHGEGGRGVHDELQACMSPILPVGFKRLGFRAIALGQLPLPGNCAPAQLPLGRRPGSLPAPWPCSALETIFASPP